LFCRAALQNLPSVLEVIRPFFNTEKKSKKGVVLLILYILALAPFSPPFSTSISSKVEAIVNENIKEGKITPETGKAFLHKYPLSRKILALYKKIEKKAHSRFTPQELQGMGIELIPWNIETTDGQPVFFKQFPLDDFRQYKVPKVDVHDLLDIRDYCYSVYLQLGECLEETEHVKTQKSLVDGTGWDEEE
jgi:hypothetical protein